MSSLVYSSRSSTENKLPFLFFFFLFPRRPTDFVQKPQERCISGNNIFWWPGWVSAVVVVGVCVCVCVGGGKRKDLITKITWLPSPIIHPPPKKSTIALRPLRRLASSNSRSIQNRQIRPSCEVHDTSQPMKKRRLWVFENKIDEA